MNGYKVVIDRIEGLNDDFIKIITDCKGNYYVGALFDNGTLTKFACSPRYSTVNGALKFAFKTYQL